MSSQREARAGVRQHPGRRHRAGQRQSHGKPRGSGLGQHLARHHRGRPADTPQSRHVAHNGRAATRGHARRHRTGHLLDRPVRGRRICRVVHQAGDQHAPSQAVRRDASPVVTPVADRTTHDGWNPASRRLCT